MGAAGLYSIATSQSRWETVSPSPRVQHCDPLFLDTRIKRKTMKRPSTTLHTYVSLGMTGYSGRKLRLCSLALKLAFKRSMASLLICLQAKATNFWSGVLDSPKSLSYTEVRGSSQKVRSSTPLSKRYTPRCRRLRIRFTCLASYNYTTTFSRNKRFGLVKCRWRVLEGNIGVTSCSGHSTGKKFSATYEPYPKFPYRIKNSRPREHTLSQLNLIIHSHSTY